MPTAKHFPARYVDYPFDCEGRECAFYLATEEYVARNLPEGNYFFTWQLNPTCVFGRNQVPHKELNLDFCNAHGIRLCRRKSGGGTIFADRNNLMLSLVTAGGSVEDLFAEYAQTVANGLQCLGVPAEVSGRNDVVLKGGGKICGNAFYHLPDRNIVHGTMLYDTDFALMSGALTPDRAKLESHGVKSVKSHISLLKDFLPFGIDQLRQELRRMLSEESIRLTEADVRAIEAIATTYEEPQYKWGESARSTADFAARIEGCGHVEFHLGLKGSLIQSLTLSGDYFETGSLPAQEAFAHALCGLPMTREAVKAALEAKHPETSVRNLTAAHVVGILFDNNTQTSQ